MTSTMEKLTSDVSKNVISQITGKLLPAISKKYSIPLDELVDLVNKNDGKDIPIKATPKSEKPKNSSNKELVVLQRKIDNAIDQEKVFNVSTGRPLADTTPNRKKYKFIDELSIAGTAGDEKLTVALKLLGAVTKKESPVHVQAAKAKKRAQVNVDDYVKKEDDSDNVDDEDDNDSDDNVDDEDDDDSDKDDTKDEKCAPVKNRKLTPKDGENEELPSKKKKKKAKKMTAKKGVNEEHLSKKKKAKKLTTKTETNEEQPEEHLSKKKKKLTIKKQISKKGSEDMDAVVKLSELADEKSSAPVSTYNANIRQWWNAKTGYIFKRRGIKNVVIGKVDKKGGVMPLTEKDLKDCKKLNWPTDTSVLKETEESDDDETSESDETSSEDEN